MDYSEEERLTMATTNATEIRCANEVKCVFVSMWDGNVTLRSPAVYYKHDHSFEILEYHVVDGLEHLDQEYIELPEGEKLTVCPECHKYVLVPVMVEGVSKNFVQDYECPSCATFGNKA